MPPANLSPRPIQHLCPSVSSQANPLLQETSSAPKAVSEGCLSTSLYYCGQQVKSHLLFVILHTCGSSPWLIFILLEEGGCLIHLCLYPVQREQTPLHLLSGLEWQLAWGGVAVG